MTAPFIEDEEPVDDRWPSSLGGADKDIAAAALASAPSAAGSAAVSLEIPGRRRLTRDFRIPYFSMKKLQKNRKHRFFGLPGPT